MFNFKVINKALTDVNLTDKEFRMLYLIVNNMSLNNTNSLEMFNGFLMDKLNLCERQVQRLSKALEEKGYVERHINSTSKNRNGIVYTLCDITDDTICDTECDKNVTPYNIEKNNIIYNNNINNNIIEKNNNILYNIEEKENNIINNILELNSDEGSLEEPSTESKETNMTKALLEGALDEDKNHIPTEIESMLVEAEDPLDEILWNKVDDTPTERNHFKALGGINFNAVDNYTTKVEKTSQRALKVPQTRSNGTERLWTYVGREHNGEQMTVQECVDLGLKWWCLQDDKTKLFCSADEYVHQLRAS